MVYLGPITQLTPQAKSKPVTGYEPDRDMAIGKDFPERRHVLAERRRKDRRRHRREPLLDSRTGQDRRQKPEHKVDIEV